MPTSDIDPWAPAVLAHPYPAFAALRGPGPAVWLEQHQLVALPRYLCVGHNLAKAEGHAILAALADRVERFEPAGDPEWIVNNTLHGLGRLPLTAVPAA